jgi:hypothetical protein
MDYNVSFNLIDIMGERIPLISYKKRLVKPALSPKRSISNPVY